MTEAAVALKSYQMRIEGVLAEALPPAELAPCQLHAAMRYATLGGGKRLRAALVYAVGELFEAPLESLDASAAAVECMHAYSLIHDDLPAMDDDDLRRGKPSCHKAFDEACAILAGDALQALAFTLLAQAPAASLPRMLQTLGKASGTPGMVAGQALDLSVVGQSPSLEALQAMHAAKTGALIRASILLGALAANQTDEKTLSTLSHFGETIGLAFQIQDDILDITGDQATLGKPIGSDLAQNKPTYPALLGLAGAQDMAESCLATALDSLSMFGSRAKTLCSLSTYMASRLY